MKLFFTSILLLPASMVFAQQDSVISTFFIKNDGTYVTGKDSADLIRTVSAPDPGSKLYTVRDFYKNGEKKLTGKLSEIKPPVLEGLCTRYYPNGVTKSTTNYKNNVATGEAYKFYPNGKLYTEIYYPDATNDGIFWGTNFLIKANYDSLGVAQVRDGNGYYKAFDEEFSYIDEEGKVKNGKRDSTWKGNFKTTGISFIEEYKDGKLVRGVSISDKGDTVTYEKHREIPPDYPGGLTAFKKYLSNNLVYPWDARRNEIEGSVILTFFVEKDGSISDITVARSVSPSIDQEAIRLLKQSPKWAPAKQFGRPVRTLCSAPFYFGLNK